MKVFQFPLGAYYLNLKSISNRNAVPVGPHKYVVLSTETILKDEETGEIKTIPISPTTQRVYDRIAREVIFENTKKGMDFFISTLNYIGFDPESIVDLIKDHYEEDFTNIIKNYILQERLDDVLPDNPVLLEAFTEAKLEMDDIDLEKIIIRTGNEELIDLNKKALVGLGGERELLRRYIEVQLGADRRKENERRTIEFWDFVEPLIRSTCKTGAVRGVIKEYKEINDANSAAIDSFMDMHLAVAKRLENLAIQYSQGKKIRLESIYQLEQDLKVESGLRETAWLRYFKARSAVYEELQSNPEYSQKQKEFNKLNREIEELRRKIDRLRSEESSECTREHNKKKNISVKLETGLNLLEEKQQNQLKSIN